MDYPYLTDCALQVPLAIDEGLGDDAILLQTFMGVSTSIGAFLFGIVILSKSQQCMISRQYLLQTSIFGIGKLFTVAGNVGFLSWVLENKKQKNVTFNTKRRTDICCSAAGIQFFEFCEFIS